MAASGSLEHVQRRKVTPATAHAAVLEPHDVVGEPSTSSRVVRHVDDRDARARRGRARDTEGSAGAARHRPPPAARRTAAPDGADMSARARATRCRSPPDSCGDAAIEQRLDLEHRRHRLEREPLARAASVEHVPPDGHVRKQRDVLRRRSRRAAGAPADRSRRGRNSTRPSTAIEPTSAVRSPAIASRVVVFPAPDGPKSAVTRAVRRSWISSVNAPWWRVKSSRITAAPPARPDSRFDHQSAANAIAAEMRTSTAASRVRPDLGERVDRDRERARRARDAAGDHDRRAELAEGTGEAEHRAGDHGRARQRQRHGQEHAQRRRAERRGRPPRTGGPPARSPRARSARTAAVPSPSSPGRPPSR